ncbi:MAG: hypothetical protein H6842_04150 [Rhodospirillaceae bacterium]|nr:hypothetical protein [Rhodospirillaceae bacterium]
MRSGDDQHSFTDVLTDSSEIIEEPQFLRYTGRFHETPDGEVFFLPLREFFLIPGRRDAYLLQGRDDERFVFNLLKLRNVLAFFLLFLLVCAAIAMHLNGLWTALPLYPNGLVLFISVAVAFLAGLVPVNLWCYLLFRRRLGRRITRPGPRVGVPSTQP